MNRVYTNRKREKIESTFNLYTDGNINPSTSTKRKSNIVDFGIFNEILHELSSLRNEVNHLKELLEIKHREENLLTTEQAAARVKKHPKTIRRWINSGVLKAKKAGNTFLICPDELEEFIFRNSDMY